MCAGSRLGDRPRPQQLASPHGVPIRFRNVADSPIQRCQLFVHMAVVGMGRQKFLLQFDRLVGSSELAQCPADGPPGLVQPAGSTGVDPSLQCLLEDAECFLGAADVQQIPAEIVQQRTEPESCNASTASAAAPSAAASSRACSNSGPATVGSPVLFSSRPRSMDSLARA